MANISRDTFDKLKHYVGVRLQQGVPIIDADWNEMEDIRKHELQNFLKEFVGNGVPKNNDFQILHTDNNNDFTIKGGICLVEGRDAINKADINYTKQQLYNNPGLAVRWGVAPLKPLSPPSLIENKKKAAKTAPPPTPLIQKRKDTVYLDVWEREVDANDDYQLVNPAIGIETCVRLKREWVVRVAEGQAEPPDPPDGHDYYPLATIDRTTGNNSIVQGDIKDLRRTGLSMDNLQDIIENHNHSKLVAPDGSPDPALKVDDNGNVGIGTISPEVKLHLVGGSDVNLSGGGFLVIGDKSTANIAIDNNEIMARNNNGTNPLHLQTNGGDLYIHNNCPEEDNNKIVFKDDGNVGIGTISPEVKLHLAVAHK